MEQNKHPSPRRQTASYEPVTAADLELAAAQAKLDRIKQWADSGAWLESGSDGLYEILEER